MERPQNYTAFMKNWHIRSYMLLVHWRSCPCWFFCTRIILRLTRCNFLKFCIPDQSPIRRKCTSVYVMENELFFVCCLVLVDFCCALLEAASCRFHTKLINDKQLPTE